MTKLALVVAAALLLPDCRRQEAPKPEKEHDWLQQFAGEWVTSGEAVAGEGKEPVKLNGTASGRMIGGFWATIEAKSEIGGNPFTGIMTIGYVAAKKKYVGTWIDSMSSHLWHYEGTVDAAGKILSLDAEGPRMDQPDKKAKYRDAMEVKARDHLVLTSAIEQEGKWVTFLTVDYRRKK